MRICWPTACAAAWTSARSASFSDVPGLTSKAIVPALGTSWRSSSSRLPPTVPAMKTTPVTLPPGRLRLVTRPSLTGSLPVVNTIGIVVVDDLARIAAKVLLTITEGRRAITSAASVSKPSKRFSAQTNSIATFRPSTSPAPFKPSLNAARFLTCVDGVPLLKKTIVGSGCCAHTTRGSATAAPPTSAMNSRRRIATPEAQGKAS